MRKLTLGVLAAGCAALLAGTIAVSMPTTVSAHLGDHRIDFDACKTTQELPGNLSDPCGKEKALICHFNEGADFGKPHCQQREGYTSHIGPLGHGHKDFCIVDDSEIDVCQKGGDPDKP